MRKRSTFVEKGAIVALLIMVVLCSFLFLGVESGYTLLLLGVAAMVPIALGATGELLCERSGLFNVGIEGMMLFSSFAAAVIAKMADHWIPGVFASLAVGGILGLIFGWATTKGFANQLLFGLGLNMLAQGLVALLLLRVFSTSTFFRIPDYLRVPRLQIGKASFSFFALAGLLLATFVYILSSKMRFGLHVRAVGLAPFVADILGIDPYKTRMLAALVGGLTAGIAGAYMSLDWTGLASVTLIQGRGFMALACVKFGGMDPIRIFFGAWLFGILVAASTWLQNVPAVSSIMRQGGSYLFLALPYITVILTIAFIPYSEPLSKTIGLPYKRE